MARRTKRLFTIGYEQTPSKAVLDVFATHAWPGNVREMEQVIRRTVIDSGGLTDPEAAVAALKTIAPIPSANGQRPTVNEEESSGDELVPLDEAERRHIMTVLRATAWNQTTRGPGR